MDNKYAGMTVNERLYVSGLMEEFDKGIKEKNVELIVSILKKVELTVENIDPILEQFGLLKNMKEIIMSISIINETKISKAELIRRELPKDDLIYIFSYKNILLNKKGKTPFKLLQQLRMDLEFLNINLLCQGSRFDVYPSDMQFFTDFAYVQTLGKPCLREDLVNIFAPVQESDILKLKTVKEQEEYRALWLDSNK